MREYYYDATDAQCKSVIGGAPAGQPVTFTFRLNRRRFAFKVLFVWRDEAGKGGWLPMDWCGLERDENLYTCDFRPAQSGLIFYRFEVDLYGRYLRLGCDLMHRAAELQPFYEFQLTVYDAGLHTPDWFKGGVMYQIFVDRFCRSRAWTWSARTGRLREDWGGVPDYAPVNGQVLNEDFFGGNLDGVTEKLDYLSALGVSTLYLNPIFEAASNHKYDTGDYLRVDRAFGDEESFRRLCDQAQRRGIRVILDGVFNHTGDDSLYFNKYGSYPGVGAYQATDSPYHSWYHFSQFPDKYRCWWGVEILPEINRDCKDFQAFVAGNGGVVEKWMQAGAAGFRLDVVDELTDAFTAEIAAAVRRVRADGLVIGEVWEDASNKVSYGERRRYFLGDELDSCMNYPFRSGILDYLTTGNPFALAAVVRMVCDHYPRQVRDALMNIVGTHDTVRLFTALGAAASPGRKEERAAYRMGQSERDRAEKLVRMASLLQYTLPGVPCVYYGDEIGTEGFEDPFNRACFDWSRTDCALREWYESLGRLRKNPVFAQGDFQELYCGEGVYLYARSAGDRRVVVGVNRGAQPFALRAERLRDYFTGRAARNVTILPEYGCVVLISQ